MSRAQARVWLLVIGIISVFTLSSFAQEPSTLLGETQKKIDVAVAQVLASTGVPSASIAIVKDGKIAYVKAYGDAKIEPKTPANPEMRYSIGSISKQFTATALLMLAEQSKGKVSLNDRVSKYVPGLTRGKDVTIRQLLSMTSGYQDFWPQDYVPPVMMKPATAKFILDRWARIPLDFEPGTKWQYSNTNYVIAGLIVEKVSGMKLMDFFKKRIFTPLHMDSAESMHLAKDSPTEPVGYLRYALGPLRAAPKEGQGWMFAAGELDMTAEDLARWDISVIEQRLMKPASYKALETEVQLKNGTGTKYALGIGATMEGGRRVLAHGGETSGFVSANEIYPDDRAAIVVLTNLDASSAAGDIAKKIRPLLFAVQDAKADERLTLVKNVFEGFQRGAIDRSLFTDNANAYFDSTAVKDFADSLAPLGAPKDFKQTSHSDRGGMGFRAYTVKFANGTTILITLRDMPDGKIEQYQIMRLQ